MVVFVRNNGEWERFFESESGPVQRDIGARAQALSLLAKAQVGKKTGRLARSIAVDRRRTATGVVWRVGSSVGYALAHHEGEKPHIIRPKRSRYLRFTSRGRVVYARTVYHPGTRANRYLSDNLRRVV